MDENQEGCANGLRNHSGSCIVAQKWAQPMTKGRWKIMIKDERVSYRIQDLDENERPRERLSKYGPQALSNAELLAILLRVGMDGENVIQLSQRLLADFGGLRGLHQATFDDVCRKKGIGPAKAAQILAAIELGRRIRLETVDEKAAIHSPADAAALVEYEMSAFPQEHLWVIILDTRNRLIHIERLYQGSLEFIHCAGGRGIPQRDSEKRGRR